jgi:MSHA biogenesis protein MshP
MTRSRNFSCRSVRRSAGVGLVTAIFLLVVLAGLGVAMVTVFTAQQNISSLDVQGARAYQAARAGIEWGLFQQMRNKRCTDSTTFPLPSNSVLNGFVVTVTCTYIHKVELEPISGPADALDRWVITALACNLQPAGGTCQTPINNPDYVQRKIEVRI